MTARRLFFALWPDATMRTRVAALSHQIHCPEGRRIIDANLHITLAFLGNVSASRYEALCKMAAQLRYPPLSVTLDELDFWQKAGIICLSASHCDADLLALKSALDHCLEVCGMEPERRAYRPHVSLFRKAKSRPQWPAFESLGWNAREFCLVQSVSHASGVEYRVLQRWPLAN